MTIVNHSELRDDLIERVVREAIDAYEALFGSPDAEVRIVLVGTPEEMQEYRDQYEGDSEFKDVREYDGVFLPPKDKDDPLEIVLLAEDRLEAAISLFFQEKNEGSRRDADLRQDELEVRGMLLMQFYRFAECLQHEYAHLCSYASVSQDVIEGTRMNPAFHLDYNLHDELIARYKGTVAGLTMLEPYAEVNVLYSLWYHYSMDLKVAREKSVEAVTDLIKNERKTFSEEIGGYMKSDGISKEEMIRSIEEELGHPLENRGEFTDEGVPKLTNSELIEFYTVDENQEVMIPVMYLFLNHYASYDGAQILGLQQAFHDFLQEKGWIEPDSLTIPERALHLDKVVDTRFFDYTNDEDPDAVFSEKKLLTLVERIQDAFTRQAEIGK